MWYECDGECCRRWLPSAELDPPFSLDWLSVFPWKITGEREKQKEKKKNEHNELAIHLLAGSLMLAYISDLQNHVWFTLYIW